MTKAVLLSITGKQTYLDQEPEKIELVTQGVMEQNDENWHITYEESALTGLEGVTTAFDIYPEKIVLTRTGKLNSQMVFRENQRHDSLYQTEYGTFMITVCAKSIRAQIGQDGGEIDLAYDIEIEHGSAGEISYHIEIKTPGV